jgi:hypothetical protein
MCVALKVLAVLIIGALLGVVATYFSVVRPVLGGGISDGAWNTSLATGSAESGPYQRASVALHGLLALNRSETIYYTARGDDDGNTLSGNCIYRIVGHDPDARWWSITAYGADDFLIPNRANRYSISKNSVNRRDDGSFVAMAAKGRAGANWIPVGDGNFSLTLRLYNPGTSVLANPAGAALPSIRKASCE